MVLLASAGRLSPKARVGVLGLTFKENVPDLRNSRVVDILTELQSFGIAPMVHDPLVTASAAMHEYGVKLSELTAFQSLDALIVAVPHAEYVGAKSRIASAVSRGGVLVDVKGMFARTEIPTGLVYWSL